MSLRNTTGGAGVTAQWSGVYLSSGWPRKVVGSIPSIPLPGAISVHRPKNNPRGPPGVATKKKERKEKIQNETLQRGWTDIVGKVQ